jgi:predicted nucleotidyltransferase
MSTSRRPAEMLAIVGVKLSRLPRRVVFIGGATTGLLLTDSAAPEARSTIDVDIIVQVDSYTEYVTDVRRELRAIGAREDTSDDAPLCRWVLDGVHVDVMAPSEQVLGFTNRWYHDALRHVEERRLPDGTVILVTTGPLFLATKIEAFRGRGGEDFMASKDMEDIITVMDGRPEIVEEVAAVESALRDFLCDAFAEWLSRRDFADVVAGHLLFDSDSQGRADEILERMASIAQLRGR